MLVAEAVLAFAGQNVCGHIGKILPLVSTVAACVENTRTLIAMGANL